MDTLLLTRQHVAKVVEMNGRDHFMDLLIRNLRTAFRAELKGHTPAPWRFCQLPR